MLDINQEQALIVSALVNQAITGLDDELFYYDVDPTHDDVVDDVLDSLEIELFLLEDLQIKLDEELIAMDKVPA